MKVKDDLNDLRQFHLLYEYISKEIFNSQIIGTYEKDYPKKGIIKGDIMLSPLPVKLAKEIVLAIRGLRRGKFIDDNNVEDMAIVPYEVILVTFKLCKSKIDKVIISKSFQTSILQWRYIHKIIRSNIPDIYKKYLKQKNAYKKMMEDNSIDFVDITDRYVNTDKPLSEWLEKEFKEMW